MENTPVAVKGLSKNGVMPKSRQARRRRSTPDFDLVAQLAADMIAEGGESRLRIAAIQKTTGISNSSLYAHFGDRDGITTAALLVLFERFYAETVGALDQVVREATSNDDFKSRLRAFIEYTGDLGRTPARLHRAAVFAGSQGRPEVRQRLVELNSAVVEDSIRSVELARARGFVQSRHSSRTIVHLIQAAMFGRIVSAFDANTGQDLAGWTDAFMCAIDALIHDE